MTDIARMKAILHENFQEFSEDEWGFIFYERLFLLAMLKLDEEGYGSEDLMVLWKALYDEMVDPKGRNSAICLKGMQAAIVYSLVNKVNSDAALEYLIKYQVILNSIFIFSRTIYAQADLCRGENGIRASKAVANFLRRRRYGSEFCKSAIYRDDLEAVEWLLSLEGTSFLSLAQLDLWVRSFREEGINVSKVAERFELRIE